MYSGAGQLRAAAASGGVLVCVAALAVWWRVQLPAPLAPAPMSQSPASRLSGTPAPAARPAAVEAPRADVVRVLPNGDVVVAGRAEPGARVALLDNGAPLMETNADAASGEFVFLPPRLAPGDHKLSLRGAADGAPSAKNVIMAFSIAPVAKPAPPAPAESPAPVAVVTNSRATIVRGDTLWRISRERLGRGSLYPEIFQANADKIRNPDRIYPGQSLAIP